MADVVEIVVLVPVLEVDVMLVDLDVIVTVDVVAVVVVLDVFVAVVFVVDVVMEVVVFVDAKVVVFLALVVADGHEAAFGDALMISISFSHSLGMQLFLLKLLFSTDASPLIPG